MAKKKQTKNEKTALPRATRKQVYIHVVAIVAMILLSLAMLALRGTVTGIVMEREQDNDRYTKAAQNLQRIQTKVDEQQAAIQGNSNNLQTPIMGFSDFYSFASNASEKFGLELLSVRAGANETSDGTRGHDVLKQHYLLHVRGHRSNLKLLLSSLNTLPSAYSIGAMSYRLDASSSFITRGIDSDSVNKWYASAQNAATQYGTDVEHIADILDNENFSLFIDIVFVSFD